MNKMWSLFETLPRGNFGRVEAVKPDIQGEDPMGALANFSSFPSGGAVVV